jgi:hypothetical protein
MLKIDLKRAYRQFPICPGDLHLVGFNWNGYLFADRVLPMGLRSSAQICQENLNPKLPFFLMSFSL